MRRFIAIVAVGMLLSVPALAAEKGWPFVIHDEDCTDLYDASSTWGDTNLQTSGDPDSQCDYDKRVSTGSLAAAAPAQFFTPCVTRTALGGDFKSLKLIADAAAGITSFWAIWIQQEEPHDLGTYTEYSTDAATGNSNSVRSEYLIGTRVHEPEINEVGGVKLPVGIKDTITMDLPEQFCVSIKVVTGAWDGSISLVPLR